MSFYHHHLFPWLLDHALRHRSFGEPRRRTLVPASGRILEIGFGTGLNLRYYPATVRRIEAIDPDVDLDRYSAPRIAASNIDVDFHHLDAEHLPFESERFDTIVCTLTLCSIPDVVHALGEVHRVLKPDGQFLFLEHGLAPDASVARLQRRLTPAWRALAGGCHLDRPVGSLLTAAGFRLDPVSDYYIEGLPRFVGFMTEGIARKD